MVSRAQGRVVARGDTLQLVPGDHAATSYGGRLGFVRGDTLPLSRQRAVRCAACLMSGEMSAPAAQRSLKLTKILFCSSLHSQ